MISLSLAARYARREMRAGLKGFYVFLMCMILGIAMISGVQALSLSLSDTMRHDGRRILGGDITLRTVFNPLNDAQHAFIAKRLGQASSVAEARYMARRQDDTRATMIEVKAVDSAYPLYGEVVLATGAPSLAQALQDNGVALEASAATRLGLSLGDALKIGNGDFIFRATIDQEPDRISSASYIISPRALISMDAFKQAQLGGLGSRVDYATRIALMPGLDLAAAKETFNTAFPGVNWRMRDYLHASPRTERLIERLTLFLTLIGLSTLLVGGIGISNAVKSFLDTKLPHIATLKALGASQNFILVLYLMQMLVLASLAGTIGIVLGLGTAGISAKILTAAFGLTAQGAFYPKALWLSLAFGFLTTVTFTLWPLGRAIRISPTELFRDTVMPTGKRPKIGIILTIGLCAGLMAVLAVATAPIPRFALYFIYSAGIAFTLFWLLSYLIQRFLKALPRSTRPETRMAIANLHRPGNATGSIILSLGLGLTVLIAISQVQYNFTRMLDQDLAQDAPSFFFLDIQADESARFETLLQTVPTARDFVITPSFQGRITKVNGLDARKALVDQNEQWVIKSDRRFTYRAAAPTHSTLTAGQWWPADYQGPPLVSIASNVARAFDIDVGDTLSVNILGMDITARIANIRDIEWASMTMNFAVTFSPGILEEAPENLLATVIVDDAAEEDLQAKVAANFPSVTSLRLREILDTIRQLMAVTGLAVQISAGMTLLAGLLVLAGSIAAARRRHVYDAVILKVLGARRRRILRIFLLEYMSIGLSTALIAILLGALGGQAVLTYLFRLPFVFDIGTAVVITGLVLVMTLLAGFLGTYRALDQKPAPYMRHI